MKPLKGKVAVVAGATRGVGRGAARALGEAGAIVYCTGRSVRGKPSPYNRPETIEQTADLVTQAGGTGIAVRVDHTVESEVKALFERVGREQGRLDVLVDDVAGQDMLLAGWTSFWETDLSRSKLALDQGLLSHVLTARYAAPLMIKRKRGLIVEVTEFDLLFCGGNILAQLVKFALKGLAVMMGEELRKHRVAAVAVTPGYLRSEFMLEHFGVTEANWRDAAKKDPNFLHSETPLFLGRAIAALAADPRIMERTTEITSSYELAEQYGFTDEDGSRPDLGGHFAREVVTTTKWLREGIERNVAWLDGLSARGRRYLGQEAGGGSPTTAPTPAAAKKRTSKERTKGAEDPRGRTVRGRA
jgi:NAD(P)-dependent dehydrogenase (short-subunit alcohol dehydrogenase family)